MDLIRRDRRLFFCSAHVLFSLVVFGVLNYFTYSVETDGGPSFYHYIIWFYCYASCFVSASLAGWSLGEYGLVVNRSLVLIISISFAFGAWVFLAIPRLLVLEPWSASLIESFARVGEEWFFRGYVYLVLLKFFSEKRRPHHWAAGWSSVAFALVHTQVFLPGNEQSLLLVFLMGLLFAYLRHWTGSVLPAITIHCFINGYLLAVAGGWVLYAILAIWSIRLSGRGKGLSVAT